MKAYLTSRNAAVVAAVAIGVTVAAAGLTTSAEAATLVSEAPFQRHLDLTCNATNSTCFRSVGPVPANERWVIQFVSCTADGSSDPNHTLRNFTLTVSTGTQVLGHHYIAPTYRSGPPQVIYVASQPMVLTALTGNMLTLTGLSVGPIFSVKCGMSGVRQKFQ